MFASSLDMGNGILYAIPGHRSTREMHFDAQIPTGHGANNSFFFWSNIFLIENT